MNKTTSHPIGKIIYASIFCIILPAFIIMGSYCLSPYIHLDIPLSPAWGYILASLGFTLIAAGMIALKVQGGRLPMNGFPPSRFVSNGIYALLPHPIYCGAVLLCGGCSIIFGSSSRLFLFTPLVTIGCMAIIWGYEKNDLLQRFGSSSPQTWFGIPPHNTHSIPLPRCFTILFFPLTIALGTIPLSDANLTQTDLALLIIAWSSVSLFLLLSSTNNSIHTIFQQWLLASLLILLLSLSFPSVSLGILTATTYILIFPLRGIYWIARALTIFSQHLSNSWKSWQLGPMRIINHSLFSFMAACCGFLFINTLTAGKLIIPLLVITFCLLIGAGLWTQLIEGSKKLLRPFGFYGGFIGSLLGLVFLGIYNQLTNHPFPDGQIWILGGALAVAAPWIQSIGRLRCMIQGCCHGRPIVDKNKQCWGIRHTNPSSRVCKFTNFTNTALHPTALYSIILNLFIGWILLLLWQYQARTGIIIGLYLALTGCARFVEEAYRGEPQTRKFFKLTEYQWLSIGFLLAFITWFIPSSMVAVPAPCWDNASLIPSIIIGLIFSFAMSMDFPNSNRRFSRLTG